MSGGSYDGGFSPPGGNPYQAPLAQGGVPGGFSATEPIRFAWRAVTSDFGGVAVPLIVGYVVVGVPGMIMSSLQQVMQRTLTESGASEGTLLAVSFGFTPVSMLVNSAVQGFMMGGITRFALEVARGRRAELATIFSGRQTFVPMFLAALLYAVCVYVGSLLCIVPGVVVALGWWLYPVLVVDRNERALDALRESWRITEGHKIRIFVFFLLMVLVGIAGCLAFCVGLFVVGAMASLSMVFIYLRLTGEEPAAPHERAAAE
jgi:uncharacterized membrane protein